MKLLEDDIVNQLITRATIRRNILTRKSVQENKPDRISDLLEEAAEEITQLRNLTFWQFIKSKVKNNYENY